MVLRAASIGAPASHLEGTPSVGQRGKCDFFCAAMIGVDDKIFLVEDADPFPVLTQHGRLESEIKDVALRDGLLTRGIAGYRLGERYQRRRSPVPQPFSKTALTIDHECGAVGAQSSFGLMLSSRR